MNETIKQQIIKACGLEDWNEKVIVKKDQTVHISLTVSRHEIPTKTQREHFKQQVLSIVPNAKIRMVNEMDTYRPQYKMSIKY